MTYDEGLKGYPTAFVEQVRHNTSGALGGETIVTYASLFLGLLLVVRALS